ncbi:hypothetical protein ACX8XN_18700 [Calditrichota bacterium GD2]
MKIYGYFLTGVFIYLYLTGCSVMIPGGLVNSTAPIPQQKYEVLGESEGSETSTTVLIFQFNKPNKDFIERATQKAIDKLGGDELINIAWYNTYTNYFLWNTYTLSVEGTVIKRSEKIGENTKKITAQYLPAEPAPPMFNGVGFSLSYSRGTRNEKQLYVYDYYDFYDFKKSVSGFTSMRLNLYLKDKNKLFYFYPQISYAKLSKEGKEKVTFSGREYEFDIKGFIRTIPITFNVGINGSKIDQISQYLPEGLNPYANFGLGYYITEFGDGWMTEWEWKEFGYNFGLGVEYYVLPGVSVGFGFNRHSVFTGTTYTFWDWSLGINYYLSE